MPCLHSSYILHHEPNRSALRYTAPHLRCLPSLSYAQDRVSSRSKTHNSCLHLQRCSAIGTHNKLEPSPKGVRPPSNIDAKGNSSGEVLVAVPNPILHGLGQWVTPASTRRWSELSVGMESLVKICVCGCTQPIQKHIFSQISWFLLQLYGLVV